MLIAVLVLVGYAFNLSHEAIISLPLNYKKEGTITGNGTNPETALQAGYVKLQPGTKIYFYTTEDENLIIGPKLQSEEEISILFLNQDDDFKKFSQFKNSYIKPDIYSVLKSGILVPKEKKHPDGFTHEECNKCVYQSLKPTYYVKGFKNILIPVDVLYSKSKQEKLFKNLTSKALLEPDTWRTDLKVLRLKKSHPEESLLEEPLNGSGFMNSTWDSNWTPVEDDRVKKISSTQEDDIENTQNAPFLLDDDDDVLPDKTCNGEVTLFVLKDDGIFKRMPSDPFLPLGMHLSFSLHQNFMFKPKFLGGSDIVMSYITGKNGDLIPHSENLHKVTATGDDSVSFMLSKNGGMFPVREKKENKSVSYYFNGNLVHKSRQFTEIFSNSSSVLVNNKEFEVFKKVNDDMEYAPFEMGEMFKETKRKKNKKHHLRKRDVYYGYDRNAPGMPGTAMIESPGIMRQPSPVVEEIVDYPPPSPRCQSSMRHPPPMLADSAIAPAPDRRTEMIPSAPQKGSFSNGLQPSPGVRNRFPQPGDIVQPESEETSPTFQHSSWENSSLRPRTDIFIFDDRGTRIRLIPEITDRNDVVIYKLTCKGNLVRYPSCKEPEFGFEIHFQLLLDEFVLVPSVLDNKPYLITYVLQENGDLIPAEGNVNTFRKAPGSLIYYMLGKNNVLFPVQQIIDMEGNVSFFYQDFFLLKMKDSTEKPLHFTTKGAPLFAFFNGFTMITISSKPRLNPMRGSNWKHLKPVGSSDGPPKAMFLSGPKGEMIKIVPYKNKQGATVVYELDCNGIFYRSPKDKKKCIILRSYILLKEGILLPSNDTTNYVYMMSKNGDLFPYLYPEGKIEAPLASSLKYVLCEKGILLPIKLEIVDNHICYFFRDSVIYKERVYCKSCLERLDEEQFDPLAKPRKSSCDIPIKDTNKVRDKEIKLFVSKDGDYVFYEKRSKILKRFPPESVPSYLKYTMGSFEVKPDGSLYQIRYQDPSETVVNLMLEPNGDLLEDTRNINNIRSQYYVLDSKGNLIAVEVKKTKKNLYFYKDHVRICRVPIPAIDPEAVGVSEKAEERKTPPLGKDPMGLMDDPFPEKSKGESKSLYIPIPLKSVSVAETPEKCKDCPEEDGKKKCDVLKDTLKQVTKGSSFPLALELELTDDIIEELKKWAEKCDKVLSRREIADDLRNYINNLNYVESERQV